MTKINLVLPRKLGGKKHTFQNIEFLSLKMEACLYYAFLSLALASFL